MDNLACAREAARQRVDATLCRHDVSWDERTPTGRLKKRWGQVFWNWLRGIELGGSGSQAAYLAALAAAEAAETACDELAENPATAAVLEKLIPWLDITTPEGEMSKGMTLAALAPFSQRLLDEDTLATFAERLANPVADEAGEAEAADGSSDASALRPAGGYTLDTKIRDLEKDPEAWTIRAKVMPGFEIGSKEAKQAGGMSIKSMARFAKDILTPEALAEIEAGFAALDGGTGPAEPPKEKGFFARLLGK